MNASDFIIEQRRHNPTSEFKLEACSVLRTIDPKVEVVLFKVFHPGIPDVVPANTELRVATLVDGRVITESGIGDVVIHDA